MKPLADYLKEGVLATTDIETKVAKLRAVQATGLNLLVKEDPRSDLGAHFVSRDYSIADRVEIMQSSGYELNRMLVEFTHDLKTSAGVVPVSCRHEKWGDHVSNDPSVIEYDHDNSSGCVERQDVDEVIKFYQEKGVKVPLLDNLRKQIEKEFQTLTPYELEALREEVEKDPVQVKALRERIKTQKG